MIKINDRFYINANSNCYTLQEKTTVKNEDSENYGKEIFKDLGYYTTIEDCLNGVLKKLLREYIGKDEENTTKELLEEIKKLRTFIEGLNLKV